jgi:Ni,Fe-hydrogenase III small subunit/NAD-dependent dihydropyrimidine dehydrogenase PreA subunit
MLKSIAVRRSQGSQFIPDPRRAEPAGFRGRPVIGEGACDSGCRACIDACPVRAIAAAPAGHAADPTTPAPAPAIDLGRCTQCGDCAPACPAGRLGYDNDVRLAATDLAGLVIGRDRPAPDPVKVSAALKQRFGRSLKLRSVSAGGCNACELEVNALANVNFDIGRYGIDFVASPRHADGLVLTGPISRNMADALQLCWDGMPDPKLVIAVGACAISGSPFEGSQALDRSFLERFRPSLYVPGCPAHPLTLLCGLLDLLGIPS